MLPCDPAWAGLCLGSQVVRRHVMAISWGADHRVVDGATVAEASNYWKALLEEPLRLLLHLR
jgi:2-oxoisovalerate dehydrogenase E2 component (dihydrolipoyl transacylase)